MAKIKVLIVDDEYEYVEVLKERLEMRDVEVIGAHSGDEAIETLVTSSVDVVVLDVMMPGKSGIDTLVEIKRDHPNLPVVMLSGHAEMDTAIKGMELGAFDYLVKPVELSELLYKLEDATGTVA